ncbi:hypothetical protein ABLE93_00800 [Xanthobacter sp. KR7-65]|uniref:hypothetical protein n=1 Tax=Xanthobacter sp. KR7-65 TaxID=3156612 RepID=UPI0032B4C11F
MSAVTYSEKSIARSAKAQSSQPAKGFFARLLEAVIAARTEQAERELARYVHLNGRDPIA